MKLKTLRNIFFVSGLMILSGGFGWNLAKSTGESQAPSLKVLVNRQSKSQLQPVDFRLFWDIWDRLHQEYYDQSRLDYQKMLYGAISGMTKAIGDPYTVFLPPEENNQAKEDLNGRFEGVGIQLGYQKNDDQNQLVVIAPLEDTPAFNAGVKAGDLILKIIDQSASVDQDTAGLSLPEAVKLIRGPKNTKVTLSLLSVGDDLPHDVTIVRNSIIIPSVKLEYLSSNNSNQKDIAWLRLLRFGENTQTQWEKYVSDIISKPKIKSIILDVRNNPGGYLTASVSLASDFLQSGPVVIQESGNGDRQTYNVERTCKLCHIPLLILINHGSASASEILAGALQEANRAKLVGTKTFGKGTVQEAQEISGGAGLHITVARWLLPSGKSIDNQGLEPDIKIEDNIETKEDEQLEKALAILSQDLSQNNK